MAATPLLRMRAVTVDAIEAAAKIRNGKLRTDTYDVCLDETLVKEHAELVAERDAALDATRGSLAGGATPELDAQIAEALERIQDATITLTFQALSRPRFRELCDAYPPRTDADGKLTHPEDVRGVNIDAFTERVIPLSLVDPKLDPATLKLLLDEHVNDRQYWDIANVIWDLNRAKVDLPFSSAASTKTRTSSAK
jgi:hypothetical protein